MINAGDLDAWPTIKFYQVKDYGGGSICLNPHNYIANLSGWNLTNGVDADNRISSHRWVAGC